jgi:hypothetical protein
MYSEILALIILYLLYNYFQNETIQQISIPKEKMTNVSIFKN